MNKILAENLKFLEKKFPGITRLIEEKKEELLKQEQINVEIERANDGVEILRVEKDGKKRYLAGKRDRQMPVQNQLAMLGRIEHSAPIIVVGLGNELYLQELQERLHDDNMLLVYEPSFTIFYTQLQRIDFSKLLKKRVSILMVGGINDEKDSFRVILSEILRGDRIPIMKYFVVPNYETICEKRIIAFLKVVTEITDHYLSNIATDKFFAEVKIENIFHNVTYMRTGYRAGQLQKAVPKDMPAIVVAAGPSLNKNIQELKKAKGKAFIIAVDTAIKPLLKEGIIPDMYATLDGKKPLELIEIEGSRNIPLLTNVDSSKNLLDYHKGKKFFYRQGYQYVDEIYDGNEKKFESMRVGGSVATLAFSLACHLGCKSVILVGQDLAYTNNRSHADGTFADKMKEEDTTNYIMVPGNYEEQVPTIQNLNGYRIWFENFIRSWRTPTRFINATEGGARIEGTEIMTLQEAIESECIKEEDIAANIEALEPEFSEKEQQKILEYFHNTPKEIQNYIKVIREGRRMYEKLQKMCSNRNLDKNAYVKLLHRIAKNTKKIEKSPYYQLSEEILVNANQILKSGQYFEYQSFEEEGKRIAEKGILFLELNQQCAEILQQVAERTVAIC